MNPDAQGDTPADVQPPEMLDKMAKENQEIEGLQAQLQVVSPTLNFLSNSFKFPVYYSLFPPFFKLKKQEVELKAAQMQVEEGTKERLRREELEAENQRMRKEIDKLPVLQKEYEQEKEMAKRESERLNKELEALPAMQKELESLRDKVTKLTQNTGTKPKLLLINATLVYLPCSLINVHSFS